MVSMSDANTDKRSKREAKRRMDDALRRALSTPHQPHKSKDDGSKAASKLRQKKVRA